MIDTERDVLRVLKPRAADGDGNSSERHLRLDEILRRTDEALSADPRAGTGSLC